MPHARAQGGHKHADSAGMRRWKSRHRRSVHRPAPPSRAEARSVQYEKLPLTSFVRHVLNQAAGAATCPTILAGFPAMMENGGASNAGGSTHPAKYAAHLQAMARQKCCPCLFKAGYRRSISCGHFREQPTENLHIFFGWIVR